MKNVILSSLVFLVPFVATCQWKQNVKRWDQKIYVVSGKYNLENRSLLKSNSSYRDIKIMSPSMIGDKETIQFVRLERYLIQMFPSSGDGGILCLDIENKLYGDIIKGEKGEKAFEHAINQFVQMVRLIKEKRPNVSVGIYGIPYKVTNSKHHAYNTKKLDRLLKECDILFPSLYLPYSYNEKRAAQIDSFIKENLNVAFGFGKRLHKAVIPFTWYMIHPSNRHHGGELLSKNDYDKYLSKILSYNFNGKRVDGVVYWDSSAAYLQKNLRPERSIPKSSRKADLQNDLIKLYLFD